MTSSLSRDLLRWLGSLDLAYPVKRPRRSLSNGYLVAEILHRYYPRDVPIHGFDTRTGKRSRYSNWGVIERILTKKGISIDHEMIQDTIDEKVGAVEGVLQQIYEHITQKNLQFKSSHRSNVGPSDTSDLVSLEAGGAAGESSGDPNDPDKIFSAPGAASMLSLESLPIAKLQVWELFQEVAGFNDWIVFDQPQFTFNPEEALVAISIKIQLACRICVRRWNFFRSVRDPDKRALIVARDLLATLTPMLSGSHPHAKDYLLNALESLLPLAKLPLLELKLGHMAMVLSLGQYNNENFWQNEVQSLAGIIVQNEGQLDAHQLQCGLLLLMSSMARSSTPVFTPATEAIAVTLGLGEAFIPSEPMILSFAQLSAGVLNLEADKRGKPENEDRINWCYQGIGRAAMLNDPASILAVLHDILPILPRHKVLSATAIRLLGKLPDLDYILRNELQIQPVPFLLYMPLRPLQDLIHGHRNVSDSLALGLAQMIGEVDLEQISPLLRLLPSSRPEVNLTVLLAVHAQALVSMKSLQWTFVRDLCQRTPMTAVSHGKIRNELRLLLAEVLSALVYHQLHDKMPTWISTLISQGSRKPHGEAQEQSNEHAKSHNTLWKALCAELIMQWESMLPDVPIPYANAKDAYTRDVHHAKNAFVHVRLFSD